MRNWIQLGVASCLVWAGLIHGSTATAEQVIDADNIVVVLDASGSMATQMDGSRASRMAVAKSALQEVVGQLPAETNLGLLVFGGTRNLGDWVYPLGPIDSGKFGQRLNAVGPSGGTPLGWYIKLGANRLLEQRAAQNGYGTYRLIIVTDGEAGDPELVQRFTPQALARGITVEVIGVAMMSDHSLARQVHAYRRADDPDSLTQALVSSIAEVSLDQNDTAGDEGFAVLAGLPDGVASAALGALRSSGNEPLGESVAAADASVSPTILQPRNTTSGQAVNSIVGGVSIGTLVFFVVLGVVLIQIVKAAAKRGPRG